MNVTAKTEYACIAVLELAARHEVSEPVRIRDIAQTHGIPSRFLVQILLQLKSAGLVVSLRGASGGYRLAKEPADITLHEVMSAVDNQSATIESSAGRVTPTTRVLLGNWKRVAARERELLGAVTFGDLVRQLQTQGEAMYHI
ncbi:MAG: Rrf2 family transcriptional regulator [Pirellulaceae bacterium]